MSTTLISAWIIGFVIQAEPLSTGAIRLTLDNGQNSQPAFKNPPGKLHSFPDEN